jgi:hypothetical protein
VGSPIGLFLVLKGDKLVIDPKKVTNKEDNVRIPSVKNFYNIFHPHDPVAYRIEPLIDKRYKTLKPAQISYTKGGLTGTIDNLQNLVSGIFSSTTDMSSNFVGTMSGLVSVSSWFKKNDAQAAAGRETGSSSSQMEMKDINKPGPLASGATESAESSPNRKTSNPAEKFHPDRRIDYVIQEGIMENAYLSALGVHMNYWPDQDCAAFILRELYGLSDSVRKTDHAKRASVSLPRKSDDDLGSGSLE